MVDIPEGKVVLYSRSPEGQYISCGYSIYPMKQFSLKHRVERKKLCQWCRIPNRHVNPLPCPMYGTGKFSPAIGWRHLVGGGHERYCEATEFLIEQAKKDNLYLERK